MDDQGISTRRAGIYCSVPHRDDVDQATVDVRERRCRERAVELGLEVSARSVFVDAKRAVWTERADGARSGWTALLAALKVGDVRVLVLYGAGSLVQRRASDGVRLLEICDEFGVELVGVGDEWDLGDAVGRRELLALATRARDAALRVGGVARAAHEKAVSAGRPHGGGRRAYGYEAGMRGLIPGEAAVVREVFVRFLDGETLRAIAWDLNVRGVVGTGGGLWSGSRVARLIDAPRYAGLRVFHGEIGRREDGGYQFGCWEPCVSVDDWERAAALRTARAAAAAMTAVADRGSALPISRGDGTGGSAGSNRGVARHHYPLTGLVFCDDCDRAMVGTVRGSYRMYACSSANKAVADRCTRHVGAAPLERLVQDAAIAILESWDPCGATALPMAVRRRADARTEVTSTAASPAFGQTHGTVAIRSIDALDGVVTGDEARRSWPDLGSAHQAAVLRFLLASVRVGARTVTGGVFEASRITVIRNVL
jgi:site-specific DNA recombinase